MRRTNAALMAIVLVVSTIGAASIAGATTGANQESSAYAGTHVSFETADQAIVEYEVNGATLVESIEVEARSDAEQRGAFEAGVGVSATTDIEGSALSMQSETETRATMETESGATVDAHDSDRGNLLVRANGESQLVGITIGADAEAEQQSDTHVVVTSDDGTQGSFILVGEGEVAVNDEGEVSAAVDERSVLVYRQYDGERDDSDREQERLIAEGTAAAEVYVTTAAEDGAETAADVVQYSEDTTVEVVTYSENEIQMTAERAESEGKVVITSVSEHAFDTAGATEVTVDGDASTQVDSYSELEAAANNGDNSAFMVKQETTAQASADVLVAVNHFSERNVAISSSGENGVDDGDDTAADDSDDGIVDQDQPGFGIVAALIALSLLVLGRTRL